MLSDRRRKSVGLDRRSDDRDRPHHVHFLVAEDVAVPDVLPAEVHELVGDRIGRVAVGVDVVEAASGVGRRPLAPSGIIGLSGRMLFGISKGASG